ncbi:MAG: Lrp/AsnC family transcriptional regulator [Thermomicrobiales bacterium]
MTEISSIVNTGNTRLDEIDLVLLTELQEQGRVRLEELAGKVGLAVSSVHERLRRLQRSGVIRRWTIDIDPAALGLPVLAMVGVRSSLPCSELVLGLLDMPEIEECLAVAGQLSMIVKVRAANPEHLLTIVERIKHAPGVENTETTIVLRTFLERGPQPLAARSR